MRLAHTTGAAAAGLYCAFALSACDEESGKPLGSGNVVAVDVDATDQPTQVEDASADSPFARVDGSYGTVRDGYAPFASCAQCACGPTTFCLASGSAYSDAGGGCSCMPIPAACQNEPNCPCLLGALTTVACYTVCSEEQGFVVYCPVP